MSIRDVADDERNSIKNEVHRCDVTENVEVIWIVVGLVVFFLLLPVRWDPAIWLKEWSERKRR